MEISVAVLKRELAEGAQAVEAPGARRPQPQGGWMRYTRSMPSESANPSPPTPPPTPPSLLDMVLAMGVAAPPAPPAPPAPAGPGKTPGSGPPSGVSSAPPAPAPPPLVVYARMMAEADPMKALAWYAASRMPRDPSSKRPAPAPGSVALWLARDIAELDAILTRQVNAILHHRRFQQMEAGWRGLQYVAEQVEHDDKNAVVVRVLNISWKELALDAESAVEFDQSQLFKKVYSEEFGMPGGRPYGLLVGDYEIEPRIRRGFPVGDLHVLEEISRVAASAFAPFIAGVSPAMLGLEQFSELERAINMERQFSLPEYAKWRSLRETDDARYVGLVAPRALMRAPHGDDSGYAEIRHCLGCGAEITHIVDGLCPKCRKPFAKHDPRTYSAHQIGFCFQEDVAGRDARNYLWGNAAFAFAGVVIRAFLSCGWLADIRGVRRGQQDAGLVFDLPSCGFRTDKPGVAPRSCTDVVITDDLEKELSDQGFMPLCDCQDTPYAAFYATPSIQKPKKYDNESATVNARLSAMLHYMLCVSRFSHYIKVIVRDKIGSQASVDEVRSILHNWITQYVTADDKASIEVKAKYPLREAEVKVKETPGKPGVYSAQLYLRPHYQLDAVTATVRLTAQMSTNG